MKIWIMISNFFRRRKPKPTTQVFKVLPKPVFEGRETKTFVPSKKLEKAIHEDNDVGHIDFNKVRKITRRYNKKKMIDFYDEDGELIQD